MTVIDMPLTAIRLALADCAAAPLLAEHLAEFLGTESVLPLDIPVSTTLAAVAGLAISLSSTAVRAKLVSGDPSDTV
jgi:hypothetical protein